MKKRQIIILVITLGIVFGSFALNAFLSSFKKESEIKTPPPTKKLVTTKKVAYSDLKTDIITYGRVENAKSLDLISEVSGKIIEGVRLKAGEKFRKGQLIFRIDQEEASLNLKSQKSNFLRELASILPDLKIDFSDNYSAWKRYFDDIDINAPLPKLPKMKSSKENTFLATKGIHSSYYSIESAEARLRKYRYYAPFSGSIMEVMLESGSFVNPGVKIGKILKTGNYEMRTSIETRDISWIRIGTEVELYSVESGQYWKGEVLRISDYVNQNTQSVDVFVSIRPNGKKVYDGQFFRASIPAQTVRNGMIMPRNAMYNGSEVFILKDSLLEKERVNVIRLYEDEIIFNGLPEGTELVVETLIGAYNGMPAFKRDEQKINLEINEQEDAKSSGVKSITN